MTKIKKDDLDPQVVEYIDGLESDLEETEQALAGVTQVAETLKSENQTLKARVAKYDVAEADDDEKFEALVKSAPPELAELLKQQRQQNEATKAQLAAMRSADQDRTMLAKAAALPHLTGTPEEIASLLKECFEVPSEITKDDGSKVTTTLGERVENMLKAANAQLDAADMFKELGGGGGSVTISKSVEAMAEELRKADPTLTIEQAITKVYEDNPDIYAQTQMNPQEA